MDPMSDKYPSLSPYNYCAWNPMKLVDPNGMESMENDDWYKNSKDEWTWFSGHSQTITDENGEVWVNQGESCSKRAQDGQYDNYFQNILISHGEKCDASKYAYGDRQIRGLLISKKSKLPEIHKKDLMNHSVATRGCSVPDMMSVEICAAFTILVGIQLSFSIGAVRDDGGFASFSVGMKPGLDISFSGGISFGYYHGSGVPTTESLKGCSLTSDIGVGPFYLTNSTSYFGPKSPG